MNTSDAFSDYNVTYSVNRSINLSPTMGRLYKGRDNSPSLGPTICLINRSRDKIEESTTVEDRREEELISKIFMMSMEIERLNQQNRRLKMDKEEFNGIDRLKETVLLKQQNQRLKMSVQRNDNLRVNLERTHANQIMQLKQKIAACQAENRTLNRRVRENQKQIEELQLKERINETAVQRAKIEASRMMEMSMHFNSTNADMRKSVAKEKNLEIQGLKQKVSRCEEIIRDQKFVISGQKQEIFKERSKQLEIEEMYERQLDFLRRQLGQSQRQSNQISQQDVKKLQSQIRDWQSRVIKSEEQLKDKCMIIANQVKNIANYQQRCLQLERKLQDLQFADHTRITRAQQSAKLANKEKDRQVTKLRKQVIKHQQQIQILRTIVEQYKMNIAEKDTQVEQTTLEMKQRLKQKQQIVRKLRRKEKDQAAEMKMSKSLSVDNTMISSKLRTSQVSLGHIVNSMMQLKDSHDRSTKILGRSSAAAKQIYYAN